MKSDSFPGGGRMACRGGEGIAGGGLDTMTVAAWIERAVTPESIRSYMERRGLRPGKGVFLTEQYPNDDQVGFAKCGRGPRWAIGESAQKT